MNDYVETILRYKWLILLVAAVMAGAAYYFTTRQAPAYQATAKVLVNQAPKVALPNEQPPATDPTEIERLTSTQIDVAKTPAVAKLALQAASVTSVTPNQLIQNVSLIEEPNSDVIDVAVTARTPELADRLASAYASAFAGYENNLATQQVSRELAGVRASIAAQQPGKAGPGTAGASAQLLTLRDELAAEQSSPSKNALVASVPSTAIQTAPKPLRNSALALILGLLVGAGLAFLIRARDPRARSTAEVVDVLGLNLLARVPLTADRRARRRNGSAVGMLSDPATVQAEAIKMLQANVELARLQSSAQVLLFTSAIKDEGKSTLVANLAVSLAQAGRNVIIVDADLRHPSISERFEVSDARGLAEVALDEVSPDEVGDLLTEVPLDATRTPAGRLGTVRVLPAGRREEQPDRLLTFPAMPAIFECLRGQADWILVDTPPMTKFYDALIISQHVDALIAVARVRRVEIPTLAEFRRLLATAPVLTLGCVATGIKAEKVAQYDFPTSERPAAREPASAEEPVGQQ